MNDLGLSVREQAPDVDAPGADVGPTHVPDYTSAPAGALPPIPLSQLGADGLPAGMGIAPVGG